MIPLKDENPTKIFPFFTIALIVINRIILVIEFLQGEQLITFVKSFGCIPYEAMMNVDAVLLPDWL